MGVCSVPLQNDHHHHSRPRLCCEQLPACTQDASMGVCDRGRGSVLSRRLRTSCAWLILGCFFSCSKGDFRVVLPWVEPNCWIAFVVFCAWAPDLAGLVLCVPLPAACHVEPQGSGESEPGFATLPPGELLLILVRFLGMEQLRFQSLRKHTAATGCVYWPYSYLL